jgi:CRP/FNR family transcriptional regulator
MKPLPVQIPPERCATCQARATCPFARLPDEVYKQFQMIAQVKPYNRGVTVFRQGEEASNLFIIRSGWVKLFNLTPTGKTITLGLAGPGDVLGLTEVMTENRYEVSSETLEESILEYVTKKEFILFLRENPTVAILLLKTVCGEMHKFLAELYAMSSKMSVDERLLHTLLDLSDTCGRPMGEDIKLKLSFTVQDLADRIGCSRQWTSKLLSAMEEQGLIRRKVGCITLTRRALQCRVEGCERHRG